MNTIGLLMVVRNEEQRIQKCLEYHMPYVDEVAICDQSSTDKTPEIIQDIKKNLKIPFYFISDKNWGYCEPSKQKTADLLNTEWILYVDPDEIFEKSFLSKIKKIVDRNDIDGFTFPRKTIFNVQVYSKDVPIEPKWLEVEHPAKDYQLRLTRKKVSTFPTYLHNRVRIFREDGQQYFKKVSATIIHRKFISEQWEDLKRYNSINKK